MPSLVSPCGLEGLERRKEGSSGEGSESVTLNIWAEGDERAVDRLVQTKNKMKNNRTNMLVDHVSESNEDSRGSRNHSVVILSSSKGK